MVHCEVIRRLEVVGSYEALNDVVVGNATDVVTIDEPGVGGVEDAPAEPALGAIAVTRPGDLVHLGPHQVLCADARDHGAIARNDRAEWLFTTRPTEPGFFDRHGHQSFVLGHSFP